MSGRLAALERPLFAGITVDQAFADQRAKALAVVNALRSDDLRIADLPSLRRQLVETFRIDPLMIEWGARTSPPPDRGSPVLVYVPFVGAAGLFDMRPSQDEGEHPTGWVREHELVLVLPAERGNPHPKFDRQKALVIDWVTRVNADVEPRNERLARTIRTRVAYEAQRARQAAALALDFGPPPLPRRVTPTDRHHSSPPTTSDRADVAIETRLRGRPRSSSDLVLERYEEALAATPRPRTRMAIAAHFRTLDGSHMGITPRHLRRLLGRIKELAE